MKSAIAILILACSILLASNLYSHFPVLQTYREKFFGARHTTTANYYYPHPTTTKTTTSSSQIQPDVPSKMSIVRGITKTFKAIEKMEGAGAKVRRSIGVPQLRNFSPFLMLDHFSVGVGAGFPDHPHRSVSSCLWRHRDQHTNSTPPHTPRGQETITYLLSGSVDHEDFAGHKGTIHTGDLQFMTGKRPSVGPSVRERVRVAGWLTGLQRAEE